ncbi:EboA domain-containing protein [Jidongwangia harbinensis]|uniref:EboA domain-containing protein n=1 Tax=Jidongwangia harbinensis TaxID=2878561 RepID=UPI001CD9518F|nr:EboA domain-containing protein [Jidongwangia harbinensis]MCA2214351.1 EboA domain-containing protein [Jidongwangia harbinensis]
MTVEELRRATDPAWLATAEKQVRADPDAAGPLFARAARALGRGRLRGVPGWTAAEAGRAVLLSLLPPDHVVRLYQQGDTAERLAVLKALPLLDIGDAGVPLLHDALRANDPRLVAAALGRCATHLDAATWRQGVVKCVFMGVPLDRVDRLDERADAELAAMLTGLAEERAAAGRTMPPDAVALLTRMEKQ